MSRPTPFQKGHCLIAGTALFLSLLLVLIGFMIGSGLIDEYQWDMLFGRHTMPEGIGGTLLGIGIIGLPVTLIWYFVARFAAW